MSFPIEFSKKSGDYDFVSPIINLAGNAAVVGFGGISLALISNFALKVLGFSGTTTKAISVISVSFSAFCLATAAIGGATFLYMATGIRRK